MDGNGGAGYNRLECNGWCGCWMSGYGPLAGEQLVHQQHVLSEAREFVVPELHKIEHRIKHLLGWRECEHKPGKRMYSQVQTIVAMKNQQKVDSNISAVGNLCKIQENLFCHLLATA